MATGRAGAGSTRASAPTKASLEGTAATPGLLRAKVQGNKASLPIGMGDLPLEATVVIDQPTATTGQCGVLAFAGGASPTCAFVPSGKVLNCR